MRYDAIIELERLAEVDLTAMGMLLIVFCLASRFERIHDFMHLDGNLSLPWIYSRGRRWRSLRGVLWC